MSGNRESTSNSIKFAPMPMSALLANLMPLQNSANSRDTSFSSADESDNSIGETVAKRPSPETKKTKEFFTPRVKPLPKDIKAFASEKKIAYNDQDKENSSENWLVNQTYPAKEKIIQSVHKNENSNVNPSSQHKKRNVLMPQNNINIKSQNACIKKTPEAVKVPNNAQKVKSATPKIKSGIRRFTPSSVKQSHKKTPQKATLQNRDRVRCELFTQNQQKEELPAPAIPPAPRPEPIVQVPAPETPMNKKPMPASYAATPSYPQGPLSNNSKVLFKTTNIKDKKYMFIKKLGVGGSSEVYKVSVYLYRILVLYISWGLQKLMLDLI